MEYNALNVIVQRAWKLFSQLCESMILILVVYEGDYVVCVYSNQLRRGIRLNGGWINNKDETAIMEQDKRLSDKFKVSLKLNPLSFDRYCLFTAIFIQNILIDPNSDNHNNSNLIQSTTRPRANHINCW